jgi:hypothetical protein
MMPGVTHNRNRSAEGAFVRGTKAFQKFAIGVLSLIVLAFVVGFCGGARRAGFAIAESWRMP